MAANAKFALAVAMLVVMATPGAWAGPPSLRFWDIDDLDTSVTEITVAEGDTAQVCWSVPAGDYDSFDTSTVIFDVGVPDGPLPTATEGDDFDYAVPVTATIPGHPFDGPYSGVSMTCFSIPITADALAEGDEGIALWWLAVFVGWKLVKARGEGLPS